MAEDTSSVPPVLLDIGGSPADACAHQADGDYCDDAGDTPDDARRAYTCAGGKVTSETLCNPGFCIDGSCVDCIAGTNACQGGRVVE